MAGKTYQQEIVGDDIVTTLNGEVLFKINVCFVYDMLSDGMSVESEHPGISRRAKQFKK